MFFKICLAICLILTNNKIKFLKKNNKSNNKIGGNNNSSNIRKKINLININHNNNYNNSNFKMILMNKCLFQIWNLIKKNLKN